MWNISDSDTLWYKTEATVFEQALPLGNGKLGAMVYGGVTSARIGLNHDELWTGVPGDGLNGVTSSSFFHAQKLALEGKLKEAQDVLEKEFCQCARVAAYQTMGDLYLEMAASEIKEYRRALFLREGLAKEEFEVDGIRVTRECLVSYPDSCLAWKITASQATDFTLSLSSPLANDWEVRENTITLRGVAPIHSPNQIKRNAMDHAVHDRHGMRFCSRCAVVTDGKYFAQEASLRILNAKELTVFWTAETSFAGFNKHPIHEGKDECAISASALSSAIKRGYNAIRHTHTKDVSHFYDRVYFSVGEDGCAEIPTDERLHRFAAGEGDRDRGLYSLMFNFGRYLMIAGSREGSRAMNLQGIWNDKTDPPLVFQLYGKY